MSTPDVAAGQPRPTSIDDGRHDVIQAALAIDPATLLPKPTHSSSAGAEVPDRGALAAADTSRLFAALLPIYVRDMGTDDLLDQGPARLAAAASSHLRLGSRRPPGRPTLRVAGDADDGGPSVVEIVTDDVDYLVDSVALQLARLGHPPRSVIHPQLKASRDGRGILVSLAPTPAEPVPRGSRSPSSPATRAHQAPAAETADQPTEPQVADAQPIATQSAEAAANGGEPGAHPVRESWMRFEIAPTTPAEREVVQATLRQTLADLRRIHDDQQAMAEQARSIADALVDFYPPPTVTRAHVRTTEDLLRWLANGSFIFLGYRSYSLQGDVLAPDLASGLGLLRDPSRHQTTRSGQARGPVGRRLTGRAAALARHPQLLIVTKTNAAAPVHRRGPMDYISVKTFDDTGAVRGEQRFLGLFADQTARTPIADIPVLREKAAAVIDNAEFAAGGRLARELQAVLERHPRDELFLADTEALTDTLVAITRLLDRPKIRLFMTDDPYGRFTSCLVYLPRDQYSRTAAAHAEQLLMRRLHGSSSTCTAVLEDGPMARLYIVVQHDPAAGSHPAATELEPELVAAVRSWDLELLGHAARQRQQEVAGHADNCILAAWAAGLPSAYKQTYPPAVALTDYHRADALGGNQTRFDCQVGDGEARLRLKVYSAQPIRLSDLLPMLSNMGVAVIDEQPFTLADSTGKSVFLYDFNLELHADAQSPSPQILRLFEQAAAQMWTGRTESDRLDGLVLASGLSAEQVVMIRTVVRYLQQTTLPYSQGYVEQVLLKHRELSRTLVSLFEARLNPAGTGGDEDGLVAALESQLQQVPSLDHDHIIRAVCDVIRATNRTNFYVPGRSAVALKLLVGGLAHLPEPRPAVETWVYSPRVEGIHLRFGRVSRGGLRWSDRRDDFRTEILGLVKAQTVKNAVIVPTGAKGGFVSKKLPDPHRGRDAWLQEGRAAYAEFITALLEITDNRLDHAVSRPVAVRCHDDDDPYLVVAADKGTADFSDLANSIAIDRGFWLGDAFASGGSSGYSHKGMGITARGAWESVKRHFLELGLDTQRQPFTVIGIGDMSGDVFGNGMLCSPQIRLVAAFDHRHIFIDPDPDPATAFDERRRLFNLRRSSWADYTPSLISSGGGVFSRAAKSIPVTDEMSALLQPATPAQALSPTELLQAILRAPVDLLWNGGIGTYVKAPQESHAEVGDKANDLVRINANELRCRVIGEGGNLGLTQLARVHAARRGVLVNTDAIDNSAGVDTSDHEVNIKVFLNREISARRLTRSERDELLRQMTDEVAQLVLRHNYEQNILLSNARHQSPLMVGAHQRLMQWLEGRGYLDRGLEFLPPDDDLTARANSGQGLTSPEFSLLVAYTKLAVKEDLRGSALLRDPHLHRILISYFPSAMQERYGDALLDHPLRDEITINEIVGSLVNRGGINFVHRAVEQTNASTPQVARAFMIAREIFDVTSFIAAVEQLDATIPAATQSDLYLRFRRLLDGAVRWLLRHGNPDTSMDDEIGRYRNRVATLTTNLPDLMTPEQSAKLSGETRRYIAAGLNPALAEAAATLPHRSQLLDVGATAHAVDQDTRSIARLYFAISDTVHAEELLSHIRNLDHERRLDALLRRGLRDDVRDNLARLTQAVARSTPSRCEPGARIQRWFATSTNAQERTGMLSDAMNEQGDQPARCMFAVRVLTSLASEASPVFPIWTSEAWPR